LLDSLLQENVKLKRLKNGEDQCVEFH